MTTEEILIDLICLMDGESQIASGCRDDYERGRYDAFNQALEFFRKMKSDVK